MSSLKMFIKEIPRFFYWGPYRIIIQHIPLKWGYNTAKLIGFISYTFSFRKKKRMREGVKFLFGSVKSDAEIEEIVKDTFYDFSYKSTEVFYYPFLSKAMVMKMADFSGIEHIEEGLKKGKGVILLHGHLGNEEFLMPGIGYMGYDVAQLASRWEPEQFKGPFAGMVNTIRAYAFRMRIGYRETFPVRFIYIDKGIREVFRSLASNNVLLLAADGREGKKWLTLNLAGKEALFSPGPLSIALSSGAVVLPTFVVRGKDLRHRIIIEGPMELLNTGDKEDDAKINTIRFSARLSKYIEMYPGQYCQAFWKDKQLFTDFYDGYKTDLQNQS